MSVHIYLVSDNQEIEEDNTNISWMGAVQFVPSTFGTLGIVIHLVLHTLAQVDSNAGI